jgi:indolepyruvate ferredoxin oxidoreductase beta subunit
MLRRFPRAVLVDAAALAKQAALPRAVNMVMVGAASCFLPVKSETLEAAIAAAFARKEGTTAGANVTAFRLGRAAAQSA